MLHDDIESELLQEGGVQHGAARDLLSIWLSRIYDIVIIASEHNHHYDFMLP